MDRSIKRKISGIIREFNWNKVLKTMQNLNWGWYRGPPDIFIVPNKRELKTEARRLLREAYENRCIRSSGGLEAQYYPDLADSYGSLQLRFVLEIWTE
jgi:hypothetical protein